MKRLNARQVKRLLLLVFILSLALCWFGGSVLVEPEPRFIGVPPVELGAEVVSFSSVSGERLSGWYIQGEPSRGAVLLLHGVRSSRKSMIPRAQFLKQRGYTVLLIDFQAHGESSGKYITFGIKEAQDAEAALSYLHSRVPAEKLGAIGVSLGGASLILSKQTLPIDALVLESVYSTIETACENRLRLRVGSFGVWAKYILLWQFPLRLGFYADELHPIAHIADLHMPILITSGTNDRHTTLEESQALCERANQPKECWWVDGAEHVDLYRFAGKAYEEKIGAFLEKYLQAVRE